MTFPSLTSLLALASLLCCQPASSATNYLYVATNGNDGWSGALAQPNLAGTDGPKVSLPGARDAVRALLAQPGFRSPTVVQIDEGTYPLTGPVSFSLSDSASATNPVVYQAAPGARPTFSGGRLISGWTPSAPGVWTAQVPGASSDQNYFEQLFIDGQRATRARSPNSDYHYVAASDPVLTNRAFVGRASDLAPLSSLTPSELTNAVVVVYHKWSTSRLRIASFDALNNLVTFTANARYVFNPGDRYHLENIPAALDEPGEWFLARSGLLSYRSRTGEDLTSAEVVAPRASALLQITGDSANGNFVQHLTFRGLRFVHSHYALPAAGVSLSQAVPLLPSAITLTGARNIAFEDCEVAQIGQNAIALHRGCRDNLITRCYLHDLGGGGIYLGETSWPSSQNNRTGSNTVHNNIIRAGGRLHHSGVGVWIGHSAGNLVTCNEISDFFYSGVSAGWTWGYGSSIAHSNRIDLNHIHHLGWGVLSDMGAVYTLGLSPGTTIQGNHAHHISAFSYGAWGLYNDEGSSGILLASNLVYDTQDSGYHQHYGGTNWIRNNIFAHGVEAQLQRSKPYTNNIQVEHNIVYWPHALLMVGQWWDTNHFLMRSNIYWQVSSTNFMFAGQTFPVWQALGQDAGSRVADPLFRDGMNRDFRFASLAAVAPIGFQPFAFTNAGVYGDPAWRALARLPSQPDSLPRPVPFTPFNYTENYEALGIGAAPPYASLNGITGGAAITVVSNHPASGERCLAITDAPGLAQAFYPYFNYSPPDLVGPLSYSFQIRFASNTRMYHEWRSYSGGTYVAGPRFWFDNLQLRFGSSGTVLATVSSNEWVRIELSVNTTNYPTQGYRLGLTRGNQPTQWWTNYPSGNGTNWNRLNWLGWVSESTTSTTFYLDDLVLGNPPPFLQPPNPPAPVISGLHDLSLSENTAPIMLPFQVWDAEFPAPSLALSVHSSNQRILADSSVLLAGTGTNRTLTLSPTPGQSGVTTVSVTADNGTFSRTAEFQVIVVRRPVLSIRTNSGGYLLSWPPVGLESQVEQTTHLAAPDWSAPPGTPSFSNSLWHLPVSSSTSRYFRLIIR